MIIKKETKVTVPTELRDLTPSEQYLLFLVRLLDEKQKNDVIIKLEEGLSKEGRKQRRDYFLNF